MPTSHPTSSTRIRITRRPTQGANFRRIEKDEGVVANPAADPAQLPPSLLNGIEQWSAQVNGDGKSHSTISTVTLVSPDGKTTQLTPAAVHAWQPLAQQQ